MTNPCSPPPHTPPVFSKLVFPRMEAWEVIALQVKCKENRPNAHLQRPSGLLALSGRPGGLIFGVEPRSGCAGDGILGVRGLQSWHWEVGSCQGEGRGQAPGATSPAYRICPIYHAVLGAAAQCHRQTGGSGANLHVELGWRPSACYSWPLLLPGSSSAVGIGLRESGGMLAGMAQFPGFKRANLASAILVFRYAYLHTIPGPREYRRGFIARN